MDGNGRVFVADTMNNRVQVFGSNHQHCLSLGGFSHPFAVGASVETPAAGFVVCDSDDYRRATGTASRQAESRCPTGSGTTTFI